MLLLLKDWADIGLLLELVFISLYRFFDRVANRVSLKERVEDFEPQPVITKDNVTYAN